MHVHIHRWIAVLYDPTPNGPLESGWICTGPAGCGMSAQLIDAQHMDDRMRPSPHERQLELDLDLDLDLGLNLKPLDVCITNSMTINPGDHDA